MSDIALAKGEKFLEDNAKKEGVTVTASGLQYKVITPAPAKARRPRTPWKSTTKAR
jgi:FKBP-type peptidyl-prolyl cis-trans isomerase FkpA